MTHPALAHHSRGFRDRYLSFAELGDQLRAWAKAFPDIVRLESIGKSREGRELFMLTIGRDPDHKRPAIWIDGNMHASELAGSSVALAIAEDAIALHFAEGEDQTPFDGATTRERSPKPPRAVELSGIGDWRRSLKDILFYVMPRMSPDGAEAVLKNAAYVRSVPRDERVARAHPRWISEDIDGDGLALVMRQRDPAGDFVELEGGVMVAREIEDAGPYYKLYPEGRIEHFDGAHVPDPNFLSDNDPDLNRNFPWQWQAEPKQQGAGAFPGSEPESAAVIDFASKTPNIFAWLNLHTFGGVHIRPPGDRPDSKMNQADLGVYRQLEHWAKELTTYPMVSGYNEFTYEPDAPIRGTLSEWAYDERGCVSWVTELWDLFARLGRPTPKRFVDHYSQLTRDDMRALVKWDREHNRGRVFVPWRKHRHPQIGEVEVGGLDIRVGITNPPYELLPEVCSAQSAMTMRVAAMLPSIEIEIERTEFQGSTALEVTITNRGYLPTHGMSATIDRPWNEALWADIEIDGGALEHGDAHQHIGHLRGWGRGRFDFSQAIFFQRSLAAGRRVVRWIVRGKGIAKIRVGSCRVGWIEKRVEL